MTEKRGPGRPRKADTFNSELADALKGLADAVKAERQADLVGDAIREATKPRENKRAPMISALNPQGDKDYPRPKFRFEKVYLPYETEVEQLTFEEIELVNLLDRGEYWVTLNDGDRMMVSVRITENESTRQPEKLFMEGMLFSEENKSRLRPMADMLREMIGAPAEAVMTKVQRREKVNSGELPVSLGE